MLGGGWSEGYILENVSSVEPRLRQRFASHQAELPQNALTPDIGYHGDPSGWAALDFADGPNLSADALHAGASHAVSF